MTVYVFDHTLDGLLTAVFDSFFLHQQPEFLLAEGEQLPLLEGTGEASLQRRTANDHRQLALRRTGAEPAAV